MKNTRPIQIVLDSHLSDAGRTLAIRYLLMPRSLLPIAMLKPTVWRVLDGDTMPCELDDVASLLPTPLQLIARDEALIIITYAEWKQRVLRVQRKEEV